MSTHVAYVRPKGLVPTSGKTYWRGPQQTRPDRDVYRRLAQRTWVCADLGMHPFASGALRKPKIHIQTASWHVSFFINIKLTRKSHNTNILWWNNAIFTVLFVLYLHKQIKIWTYFNVNICKIIPCHFYSTWLKMEKPKTPTKWTEQEKQDVKELVTVHTQADGSIDFNNVTLVLNNKHNNQRTGTFNYVVFVIKIWLWIMYYILVYCKYKAVLFCSQISSINLHTFIQKWLKRMSNW